METVPAKTLVAAVKTREAIAKKRMVIKLEGKWSKVVASWNLQDLRLIGGFIYLQNQRSLLDTVTIAAI